MTPSIIWIKGPCSMMAAVYAMHKGPADLVHVGRDPFVKEVERVLKQSVRCVPFLTARGPSDQWLLTRSAVLGEAAANGELWKSEYLGLCNDEQAVAWRYRYAVGPHGPKLELPLVENSMFYVRVRKWCVEAGIDMDEYERVKKCA